MMTCVRRIFEQLFFTEFQNTFIVIKKEVINIAYG